MYKNERPLEIVRYILVEFLQSILASTVVSCDPRDINDITSTLLYDTICFKVDLANASTDLYLYVS